MPNHDLVYQELTQLMERHDIAIAYLTDLASNGTIDLEPHILFMITQAREKILDAKLEYRAYVKTINTVLKETI